MRVAVTGGYGFLGGHVTEELESRGNVVVRARSHHYDLRNFHEADEFLRDTPGRIDALVHCAAFVGGIQANVKEPARMMYDNLRMGLNVLEQARRHGIQHVVMVGTACSYPDAVVGPLYEDHLFQGRPATDTAPYGIAKLALFETAKAYAESYGMKCDLIIPSNLYGPGDNYDPERSHVIPSLIQKFSESLTGYPVEVWGDGTQTRDFLYVEDAARGVASAVQTGGTDGEPINLGSGRETSIRDVAEMLTVLIPGSAYKLTGSGPVGTKRRVLDISRAKTELGWEPKTPLMMGLALTVEASPKIKVVSSVVREQSRTREA